VCSPRPHLFWRARSRQALTPGSLVVVPLPCRPGRHFSLRPYPRVPFAHLTNTGRRFVPTAISEAVLFL
jgi:hypothetical protein